MGPVERSVRRHAHRSAMIASTPETIAAASLSLQLPQSPCAALFPISAHAVICFCLAMLYAPFLVKSAFILSNFPIGTPYLSHGSFSAASSATLARMQAGSLYLWASSSFDYVIASARTSALANVRILNKNPPSWSSFAALNMP